MASRTQRNYIFYVLMLLIFGALMWWVAERGSLYDTIAPTSAASVTNQPPSEIFTQSLKANFGHSLALLLLQIIAILISVRIFSFIFKYLGQPGVIGEIVAGIVLGPSLLGYFFPEAYHFLFTPASLEPLNIISQIGLILFMFVIGMELDLSIIKKKASETLVISHASIIVPFFMGLVLAYFVYPEFGAAHAPFLPFALFIGISISITAFPVLARIIQERNLSKTPMGMLAIASAANNDITAWCMLAAIIAIAKAGSMVSALYTIGLACIYIIFMFGAIRPFMRKLGNLYNNQEVLNKTLVAFIFLVLILSSYITEVLGVHALFGAFLAGVIMPDNISFRRVMTEKIEDVALVLFLPLFFVFTGLRTEIGLLNTPHLWTVCAIFIAVSIAGKLIGAAASARFVGESWKDSLSIGVLMNTRGLMELIVLNIGYEMKIIPSSVFVIFVIMALFTTFMATPCLILIEKLFAPRKKKTIRHAARNPRILISFGDPASGPVFMKLIEVLYGNKLRDLKLTAIHYTIGTDTSPINTTEYSEESFSPLLSEAARIQLPVETLYKVTDHFVKDLTEMSDEGQYDFVMVGGGPRFISEYTAVPHRYLFFSNIRHRLHELLHHKHHWNLPGVLPRDRSRTLFNEMQRSFGVFVNRQFSETEKVGIMFSDYKEKSLLRLCETLAPHTRIEARITNPHLYGKLRPMFEAITEHMEDRFSVAPVGTSLLHFIEGKQLLIISYRCWLNLTDNHPELLQHLPSFIIIKPREN